jgi:hypothetical protein
MALGIHLRQEVSESNRLGKSHGGERSLQWSLWSSVLHNPWARKTRLVTFRKEGYYLA